MRSIRTIACTAAWLLLAGGTAFAQNGAEALVRRGIEALHWFEYEQANEAFRAAQAADPESVLAVWGEAMTYDQTLWRREDVAAARRALARLGPTEAARAARARTDKERMLLAAAEARFGPGDTDARKQRYAGLMARLYAREPGDPDVASFYALALLGTMSRSLIGYVDAHEGHSASLAGSDTQARVTQILRTVLAAHPGHPGALHYLLHNDDDPAHARDALDAARMLATLAPDSSHARHMPSHIFLQLGLWREASASDASAFTASSDRVAREQLPPAMRNYHALAWLQYELLQQGRRREARATLDELEPVVKSTNDLTLLGDLSSMRARYVVESESWPMLATADAFGNVNELFAVGMSAVRTGGAARAERARQVLAEKQRDAREGDLRPAIAIMERELAALIAFAAGRRDEALTIARAASDAELRLPAPLGLPVPIKPAPELLGELLLESGRAADAGAAFDRALERNANRSLAVLGRARAAAAAGDATRARGFFDQLLDTLRSADADVAVVQQVRSALDALPVTTAARAAAAAPATVPTPAPTTPPFDRQPPAFWWLGLFASPGGLLIVGLCAGAVVLTWLVARRSDADAPAHAKRRAGKQR